MSNEGRCKFEPHLNALLAGTLSPEAEEALTDHLRECRICRERLDDLSAQDTLLSGEARKYAADPPPQEHELLEMIQRLRSKKPWDKDATTEMSRAGGSSSRSPSSDISLEFLTPSNSPQSLGKLGEYEIVGVIGSGGMGIVLKARDPGLERIVAIKVLKPELAANGAARRRFAGEAQKAAAVMHDHVVTIHAVGEANGLPYIVMEYIVGVSLDERIRRTGPLKVEEILRIGMQAASGLAAAHAQGLVHRDIKPSNILLENGVERVKIADFGLARAMDDMRVTREGAIAGTPEYMSPEQARDEPIDHRSDLFSLGCVLYAMCTGRSPFRASNLAAAVRRVCEDTPRPIREVNPDVPDWLAGFIEVLLAKDSDKRLQTATEVSATMAEWLGELQQCRSGSAPIGSFHPRHRIQRPRRLRTNKLWWLATAVGGACLLAAVVAVNLMPPREDRVGESSDPPGGGPNPVPVENARLLIDINKREPNWAELTVEGAGFKKSWSTDGRFEESIPAGIYHLTVRDVETDTDVRKGRLKLAPGSSRQIRVFNQGRQKCVLPPQEDPITELVGHCAPISRSEFNPDGEWLISAGTDNEMIQWTQSGSGTAWRAVRHLEGEGYVIAKDGRSLISGTGDGALKRISLDTGEVVETSESLGTRVVPVQSSHAGLVLCLDLYERKVLLVSEDALCVVAEVGESGSLPASSALSPDARLVATGHDDAKIRIWSVTDQGSCELTHVLSGHALKPHLLAFSPNGLRLVSASKDTTVQVWRVDTGEREQVLGHARCVAECLTVDPGGERIAVGCADQSVKVWELKNGRPLHSFHADWGKIGSISFSPGGDRLVTGSDCNVARIWDGQQLPGKMPALSKRDSLPPLVLRGYLSHVTFWFDINPDGTQVAMPSSFGWILRLGLDPPGLIGGEPVNKGGMAYCSVGYINRGETLGTAGIDNVSLWNTADMSNECTIRHGRKSASFAASRDGSFLIVLCGGPMVSAWDAKAGKELYTIRTASGRFKDAVFSPTATRVALSTTDDSVGIYEVGESEADLVTTIRVGCPVGRMEYSPDGQNLVTFGRNAPIQLWDANTGDVLNGPDMERAITACYSHDGKILAVGRDTDEFNSSEVVLLRTSDWTPVARWEEPGYMQLVRFSSNGYLGVLTNASYLNVWDITRHLTEIEDAAR
jgi:serine/threonine protein kinase/WD40 repeat protein